MPTDPHRVVVENPDPDFFWRPMRSDSQLLMKPNGFLVGPQSAMKSYRAPPVMVPEVNPVMVRPGRATMPDERNTFFLMRPMKRVSY